jgi:hypothetical protein
MGGNRQSERQKLDSAGCQTFKGVAQKPAYVMDKHRIWDPVKKGHCSAQLCSTGAACIVCSGCQKQLSPAKYSGTWNQHKVSCEKLAQKLAEQQATPPKKRKAAEASEHARLNSCS